MAFQPTEEDYYRWVNGESDDDYGSSGDEDDQDWEDDSSGDGPASDPQSPMPQPTQDQAYLDTDGMDDETRGRIAQAYAYQNAWDRVQQELDRHRREENPDQWANYAGPEADQSSQEQNPPVGPGPIPPPAQAGPPSGNAGQIAAPAWTRALAANGWLYGPQRDANYERAIALVQQATQQERQANMQRGLAIAQEAADEGTATQNAQPPSEDWQVLRAQWEQDVRDHLNPTAADLERQRDLLIRSEQVAANQELKPLFEAGITSLLEPLIKQNQAISEASRDVRPAFEKGDFGTAAAGMAKTGLTAGLTVPSVGLQYLDKYMSAMEEPAKWVEQGLGDYYLQGANDVAKKKASGRYSIDEYYVGDRAPTPEDFRWMGREKIIAALAALPDEQRQEAIRELGRMAYSPQENQVKALQDVVVHGLTWDQAIQLNQDAVLEYAGREILNPLLLFSGKLPHQAAFRRLGKGIDAIFGSGKLGESIMDSPFFDAALNAMRGFVKSRLDNQDQPHTSVMQPPLPYSLGRLPPLTDEELERIMRQPYVRTDPDPLLRIPIYPFDKTNPDLSLEEVRKFLEWYETQHLRPVTTIGPPKYPKYWYAPPQ
ncbi:MAG: hypothetical protein M1482_12715 [Chloroflexi bacterium]|nr:hypothetical protein [Chloroflexota bacterium]